MRLGWWIIAVKKSAMPIEGITRRQLAGTLLMWGMSSEARADVHQLEFDHFKLRVSDLARARLT